VADEDIQTQSVRLSPVYESPSREPQAAQQETPPQVVAFRATNTVRVTIRDLDALGSILDAVVQAGGNQIQNIDFQLEDPSDALDQARTAAWEDAMQKAQQLSELAGVQLGAVVSIQESGGLPRAVAQERLAVGGAGAVPIRPGTLDVTVDLQVTWELFVVPGMSGSVSAMPTATPTASGS